jgi:hypothetical protein
MADDSMPGLPGVPQLAELIEQCERTQELAERVQEQSAALRRAAGASRAHWPDWSGLAAMCEPPDVGRYTTSSDND